MLHANSELHTPKEALWESGGPNFFANLPRKDGK